jgi:enoyl-CoA hydratase/carnithine racemase
MATSDTELIKLDLLETGVAVLQLNRPKKRNAFNQAMINEIVRTLRDLDKNDEIRAVVVTGGESAHFCGMFIQSCADCNVRVQRTMTDYRK